MRLKFDTVVRT